MIKSPGGLCKTDKNKVMVSLVSSPQNLLWCLVLCPECKNSPHDHIFNLSQNFHLACLGSWIIFILACLLRIEIVLLFVFNLYGYMNVYSSTCGIHMWYKCVWWVCTCVCTAMPIYGSQRKTLCVFFSNSLPYSFDTQSFIESGVRLMAIKSQHTIFVSTLLLLQAHMRTPGFLHGLLTIQTQVTILVQQTVFLTVQLPSPRLSFCCCYCCCKWYWRRTQGLVPAG